MREIFEILRQTTAPAEPCEGTLDNPSAREKLEPHRPIRPLDDLNRKLRHCRGGGVPELLALITSVREQFDQKGISPEQRGQHKDPAITILDIRRMNHGVQKQTYRVDQDMSFLSFDFLAGIIAGRIDRGPPFSALFTLWLSMTQAVGLASRSACSRHFT